MRLLRLVLKSLVTRKANLLTTVALLAIATAGLFVSALITGGLNNGLKVGVQRLGADIILLPDEVGASIEDTLFTGVPMSVYMTDKILANVQAVNGIEQYSPQFFTQTLNQDCCSLDETYRLVGIDPDSDFVIQPWLKAHLGRSLQGNEIITGAKVETFIGGQVGILSEVFIVAGNLAATGTSIDETIFLPIDSARRLAANSKYLQEIWRQRNISPMDQISAVLIKIKPGASADQVMRDLSNIPYAKAFQPSQINKQAKKQINLVLSLLIYGNVLLWAICLVAILSYFIRNTLEKKSEIGILRAMGATRLDVIIIVLVEAAIFCLIGSLVGITLGELLYWLCQDKILAAAALPYLSVGPLMHLKWASVAMFAGMGMGVAASLYPAYFSASLDPARAITAGELE
ncbi:MAG: FtsX-like permease family protein [Desulfosporosinus sp.]